MHSFVLLTTMSDTKDPEAAVLKDVSVDMTGIQMQETKEEIKSYEHFPSTTEAPRSPHSFHVGSALRAGVRRRVMSKHMPNEQDPFLTRRDRKAYRKTVRQSIYREDPQAKTRGRCTKCVHVFFGTTPDPKPCGSCGYQVGFHLFVGCRLYVFG